MRRQPGPDRADGEAPRGTTDLIDLFSLALTHGLMALAAWRLVSRVDLDREPEPPPGA